MQKLWLRLTIDGGGGGEGWVQPQGDCFPQLEGKRLVATRPTIKPVWTGELRLLALWQPMGGLHGKDLQCVCACMPYSVQMSWAISSNNPQLVQQLHAALRKPGVLDAELEQQAYELAMNQVGQNRRQ